MFDYFGHSVQNYGESLIFALIFNFRRLKLQRFFKRETMKCVKVKKYVHTRNPIWFFVILFQFLFISFCLRRNIFTHCVKVKAPTHFYTFHLLNFTVNYISLLKFPPLLPLNRLTIRKVISMLYCFHNKDFPHCDTKTKF